MRWFVCAACFLFLTTCGFAAQQQFPYQDVSLPSEQRAADLVHRMTLDEKVGQMGSAAKAIPRLGVPAYNYWNEALHGVARSGYATMFPQAIGLAATWDAPLLRQTGDAIATEARAKNAEALRHNNHDIYFGLTFWSPNINIFRDPRWGRGQETYGEDPFLTGRLALNFIAGLQGDDPRYYKVIATPKHFAVHSGPENTRHKFDVDPSTHDLWDTYLPQFRTAIVDAKAASIMCAYNAVDKTPACGSHLLLDDVLRKDWHFQGFVTSDCGAIDDFFKPDTHRVEPDAEHADRDALLAGTDTNCGSTYERLGSAVRQGLLRESDLDVSLIRLFTARMRLGLFDPPERVAYARIPFSAVHSPENAALAQRAAEESMVLLKNDGTLPLAPGKFKRIAVIGPNAAMLSSLEGNYNGTPYDPQMPVDALTEKLCGSKVVYAAGAPFVEGFMLPVPRTMLHPAQGSKEQGLQAEYMGSGSLDGRPVLTRIDREINFDWSGVNPLPGHPSTGFAVRWSGTLTAPVSGEYNFRVDAGPCQRCAYEQSYKVLIDGKVVAEVKALDEEDSKTPQRVNGTTGLPEEAHQQHAVHFSVALEAGQPHHIEVDFLRKSAEHGTGITLSFLPPTQALLEQALETARDADLIVAMLGLTPTLEGEEMSVNLLGFQGGDRTDIALPATQEHLLEQLVSLGKPVVVVLLNGSALAVNFADKHANAILEAWYPGEAGARAIADTLAGDNNPAGRLPITFYRAIEDLPPFSDYSMDARTYRYFKGHPLYAFGYGLSYTKFAYSDLRVPATPVHAGDPIAIDVTVTNAGSRAGDEVAELYLSFPELPGAPRWAVRGFQRVHLDSGQSQKLHFALQPRDLGMVTASGEPVVSEGRYTVSVGGGQPGAGAAMAEGALQIVGSQELPR